MSYRYRGKVERKTTHTNVIIIDKILEQIENKYLPKNRETPRDEKRRILAYSAKKIKTNPTEAYSILKPDTSSDSPSEKSNGVRFVSAIIITNHKTYIIGLNISNNFDLCSIEQKLNLKHMIEILIIIKAKLIS